MGNLFKDISGEIAVQNDRFKPWFEFSRNIASSGALVALSTYVWKDIFATKSGIDYFYVISLISACFLTLFCIMICIFIGKSINRVALKTYDFILLQKVDKIEGVKRRKMRYFPLYVLCYIIYLLIDISATFLVMRIIMAVIAK